MVDSFSTADNKYSFEIDGKPHVLPSLSVGDLDLVSGFSELDDEAKMDAVKDLIFSKADKRTTDAIRTLSVFQFGTLYRKWAGLTPGESPTSGE